MEFLSCLCNVNNCRIAICAQEIRSNITKLDSFWFLGCVVFVVFLVGFFVHFFFGGGVFKVIHVRVHVHCSTCIIELHNCTTGYTGIYENI